MDCLSIPDSGEYNCSNKWGTNCTNTIGFDFKTLWNITQRIQQYCPTDPRLWRKDNASATFENAALTGQACDAFAGTTWTEYSGADVWSRLTTWKFPLLQLVASSPRPPLGFAVEAFVIVHLLGDPIGTNKDLLCTISNCQRRADFWRAHLIGLRSAARRLTHAQEEHVWKAFTIITISYDEWGKGDEVQQILRESLDRFLAIENSTADLETLLQLSSLTANTLAADRSTKFLPIIVAQCFFVGGIAIAIAKITSNTSSTSFFINVEAHSIAFSALYFWILPAVFLSSVIGVSQTQDAIPRILRQFQEGLERKLLTLSPMFPNHVLDRENMRIVNGGIYSWQPDQAHVYKSKRALPTLQRNLLPVLIVVGGTVTAMLVSGYVPPEGWQPRHCAYAFILLTWILSSSLTYFFKRYSQSYSYNIKWPFWCTFLKDMLATIATMGCIFFIQFGVFNRCDSYTRWGKAGLALPEMPDVAAILDYRINVVYPAIVFVSIGLQMFIIPFTIAISYRHALLVFLQRDNENSSFLPDWKWRWVRVERFLTLKGYSRRKQHPPPDPETLTAVAAFENETKPEQV